VHRTDAENPVLAAVIATLDALAEALRAAPHLLDPSQASSSSLRNLEHYVALRRQDLRVLQEHLAALGLSSLGGAEPNVLAAVEATRRAAHALAGRQASAPDAPLTDPDRPPTDHLQGAPAVGEGRALLARRADDLFGPPPTGRRTRIMVTMPTEAATDRALVERLVDAGMDVARINTAHDDPETWRAIAARIREAQDPHRPVAIFCDLAGPKLRTGPIQPGPQVRRLRPTRDVRGVVRTPVRVRLVPPGTPPVGGDLPIDRPLVDVTIGARLRIIDARGARREGEVVASSGDAAEILLDQTCYLETGTALSLGHRIVARVAELPSVVLAWELGAGDVVELTADLEPADVGPDERGVVRIGCTLPEVLVALRPGHRVRFDDGRVAGVVSEADGEVARIHITAPVGRRVRLRSGKGINVPDTDLAIPALTSADVAAVDVAVEIADIVALSFVGGPSDVEDLHRLLETHGAAGRRLGVVAKIETARGFRSLPDIVARLLTRDRTGVMIARGDLAVEVGYERLAEVQEEVLWLAEAAHLPAIWATQVLDELARTGSPSRAEITDAAWADRAECVMLNKGPYVAEAVTTLSDILGRMDGHLVKKQALLRRLHAWG
jgi:pyruvate kinase